LLAHVRCWHEAADHTLIADSRFLGEADIHGRAAPTASVVHDPQRQRRANFAVTHNAALW
jgi:hypothetical protein